MTRWTSRRLSQRLESGERLPEPPPGLLEKLKSDVPTEVEVDPHLSGPVGQRSLSRQALPLAASLTALLGGGLLAIWLLRQPFSVPEEVPVSIEGAVPAETGDLQEKAVLLTDLDESLPARPRRMEDKEAPPAPEAPKKLEQRRLLVELDEESAETTKDGAFAAEAKPDNAARMTSDRRDNLVRSAVRTPAVEERLGADARNGLEKEKQAEARMVMDAMSSKSASAPMKGRRESVKARSRTARLTATPCPGEPDGSCVIVVMEAAGTTPVIEPEMSQIRAIRELGPLALGESDEGNASLQGIQRLYRLELSREIDPDAPLAKVQSPGRLEAEDALFPSDVAARWSDTPARVRLVILQALLDEEETSEILLQEARQVALELPEDPVAQALGERAVRRLDRP